MEHCEPEPISMSPPWDMWSWWSIFEESELLREGLE